MKIYIAGPMTGIEDYNFPAFHGAADQLRAMGHDPINPATSFGGRQDLPYDMYIREAVRMVAMADAIILLDGWERSKGALTEDMIAVTCGLPFYEFGWPGEIYQGHTLSYSTLAHWLGQLDEKVVIDDSNRALGEDEVGQEYTGRSVAEGIVYR